MAVNEMHRNGVLATNAQPESRYATIANREDISQKFVCLNKEDNNKHEDFTHHEDTEEIDTDKLVNIITEMKPNP